jgi:hypothetical protein
VRRIVLLLLVLAASTAHAQAQNGARPSGLRLFLDCEGHGTCDQEYIRTEIDYVDHVRDRTQSDVHLLVTTEGTASGGRLFTLAFLGRGAYASISDTLSYASLGTDTWNELREGLTRMIAVGLVPYLARTALAGRLRLSVDPNGVDREPSALSNDPWNYWVFGAGVSAEFEGEESQKDYRVRGDLSANRTTEDWKVRLSTRGDFRESRYTLEDTSIVSIQRDGEVFGFVAASLGPHWSVGGSASANTSTRRNIEYSVSGGPTVEYNIYPYSESTRRELRLQYRVGIEHVLYDEETIFDRLDETLLAHEFEVRLDQNQPWGGTSASLEMTHYLTNFDRSRLRYYSVEVDGGINVRIVRGLSVFFSGGVEFIHDQLYLSKEDASDEDVLLGRVSLPTSYEFRVEAGLNYSFGSIFNNVVNPRFGF